MPCLRRFAVRNGNGGIVLVGFAVRGGPSSVADVYDGTAESEGHVHVFEGNFGWKVIANEAVTAGDGSAF